ncbi:rhizopuspepsin precursor-like protein [Cunninghamella echinulata]|nr:rhizopuspepsin precursor-like protein [Cunninghamella echinulata]
MKLTACATLLLATAALLDAAPAKKSVSFGLSNNPNYKPDPVRDLYRAKAKYAKYLGGVSSFGGSVPVTDHLYDVEYYGSVEVGTPPQKLNLNFDTGSSDLWFASTLCSSCGTVQNKYDPKKSSTYKAEGKPWKISYGDGSNASGVTAYDSVNLGGLVIKNQRIELAKQESESFQKGPADGLVGLAFNNIATVKGTKTPVDNLIEQKLISEPIYGVWLGKAKKNGGGEYLFGAVNKSKVGGEFTTVPVDKSQGFWTINVDDYSVGTGSGLGKFEGIVDTGTTLLVLADSIAAKLAKEFDAKETDQGLYSIDCKNTKDLTFTIGGTKFVIPAEDAIFVEDQGTCYASFAPSGSEDFSILGDVFLKNVYTVFDQTVPEVKFAKLKE